MARLTKSQRFDAGIQSSKRLNPESAFAFIKGDVSDDPFAVKPAKTLTKINEETEISIKAIGESSSGDLLGLGDTTEGWLTRSISTRWKVDASGWSFNGASYFDMSQLSSDFWDNVTAVTDVKVTSSSHQIENFDYFIVNFDADNETGIIVSESTEFYIYISSDFTQSQSTNLSSISADYYFPMNGSAESYKGSATVESEGTYTTGLVSSALNGNARVSLGWGGSSATITWAMKVNVSGNRTIMLIENGSIQIEINNNNTSFDVTVDGTVSNPVWNLSAGIAINDNEWHTYTLYLQSNVAPELHVDGTLASTGGSGNFGSFDGSGDTYFYGTSDVLLDEIYLDQSANGFTPAYPATYNSLRTGINRVLSAESFDTSSVTYGAAQVYQLGDDNLWDDAVSGQLIQDKSATSTDYGIVFQTSSIYTYWTSRQGSGNGIYYLSQYDQITSGTNGTFDSLQSIPAGRYIARAQYQPNESAFYMPNGSTLVKVDGGTSADDFGAGGNVRDLVDFGTYLAYVYQFRSRVYSGIYNLVSNASVSFSDMGQGIPRVMEDFGGVLYTVVDNFVNDDTRRGASSSLDIRAISGESFQTLLSLDATESGDTYTAMYAGGTTSFNQDISYHKAKTKNGIVFWANIIVDGEQRKGLWQLARNVITQDVALTFYADFTSEPVQIMNIGNIIYVLDVDGNLWKSSDTDEATEIVSCEITAGSRELDKKYDKVRTSFEPLTASQSVSLYYKTSGGSWNLVETFTGTGEKKHAFIVDAPYDETIQYKLVGTGGVTLTGFTVEGEVQQAL